MLKIKFKDGHIEDIENPQFITILDNNEIVLCKEQYAKGIVSADGENIYQIKGKNLGNDYEEVELLNFSAAEELNFANIDYIAMMTGIDL